MNKEAKRRHLFNLYVDNLRQVKQHDGIRISLDLDDHFLCPLCFRLYSPESLCDRSVSLEHAPPEAAGGKDSDCTLTCTQCNNVTGSQLESRLKDSLERRDLFDRVPGASIDIEYRALPEGEDMWLPATLESTLAGFNILGHADRAHPDLITTVSSEAFMSGVTKFQIRFEVYPQRTAAALLKIAYLFLFRLFGYAAVIPSSMQSVRQQILNPAENILPKSWIVNWPILEDYPGITLVLWPDDLRAYLVTFVLDSGRRKQRFGVVLPQPDDIDHETHKRLLSGMSSKAAFLNLKQQEEVVFVQDPFYIFGLWDWFLSNSE